MSLPDQSRGTRDNEGQKEEANFRIPVDCLQIPFLPLFAMCFKQTCLIPHI